MKSIKECHQLAEEKMDKALDKEIRKKYGDHPLIPLASVCGLIPNIKRIKDTENYWRELLKLSEQIDKIYNEKNTIS